ncbi:DUF647 domain-containing protein [Venturia nashicola]|uniref:DUF647 domain-containing protein n=1 Tax=Venturia nashicola TaxID=86259 RepID=A0A4Z1P5N5_9PEZI|nr:DUF647 domain-containing protein [Venturia nashicola]TLD30206.1 DUF647 domain-containing protein [Venturia nashicola]
MVTSTITTTASLMRVELVADLEIAEYDKAGVLKATYVESTGVKKGPRRVDVVRPKDEKGLTRRLVDIFLPDGYPHCVSDDYTPYQLYDTFQALAGSISGMISSRAVWEGIGVGNSLASPTGAVLINVTRECFGRFATITFAHAMGTSIDAECKAHRLLADFLCDLAMVLDCLTLSLPSSYRLPVLCLSSTLFAASGVSGRSAKSSLSSHFAKWNNIAELNATESSQETVVSLMGMLLGSIIIYLFPSRLATWVLLFFLLPIHLLLNAAAVRAVKLRTINRQRANILLSELAETGKVLTPKDVAAKETIFESRGGSVFRWQSGCVLGHCDFGVSLQSLLRCLSECHSKCTTNSTKLPGIDLTAITKLFHEQQYLLWCHPYTSFSQQPQCKVLVVLKQGITPESQFKAWYHALLLSRLLSNQLPDSDGGYDNLLQHVTASLDLSNKTFDSYARRLKTAGWELGVPALETRLGSRVVCERRQPEYKKI